MAEKDRKTTHLDPQEFELPETVFSRDVNNKVFLGIVEKTILHINGVALQSETLIDQVIGRTEKYRGITAIQDPSTQTIKIKIELSIKFGINIPQKAEEIQTIVAEELTKMTGLHVSEVHIIFKDLIEDTSTHKSKTSLTFPEAIGTTIQDEFENDF